MRKKGIVILLAAACVCVISLSYLFADEGQAKKMDAKEIFYHKAKLILSNAGEIGLSDDQIEKIKTLKSGVKKNLVMKEAEIEVLGLDIKEMLFKDEIDKNALSGLIDKKYEIKKQNAKDSAGAYVDLKAMLTKEQQKKLKEICSKRPMMKENKQMMMHGKGEMPMMPESE